MDPFRGCIAIDPSEPSPICLYDDPKLWDDDVIDIGFIKQFGCLQELPEEVLAAGDAAGMSEEALREEEEEPVGGEMVGRIKQVRRAFVEAPSSRVFEAVLRTTLLSELRVAEAVLATRPPINFGLDSQPLTVLLAALEDRLDLMVDPQTWLDLEFSALAASYENIIAKWLRDHADWLAQWRHDFEEAIDMAQLTPERGQLTKAARQRQQESGIGRDAAQVAFALPESPVHEVLAAMATHVDRAYVQARGLEALRAHGLCYAHGKESATVALGTILRVVIQSMQEHCEDAVVARCGCGALFSFTCRRGEHIAAIRDLGGIELVHQAMHLDSADVELQRRCCGVLRNMAVDKQIAADVGRHACVGSLVLAMRCHPADGDLQRLCCGALQNLAHENRPNSEEIGLHNGAMLVQAAMRAHPKDIELQWLGCGCLCNLSFNKSQGSRVSMANAVTVICSAMVMHPGIAQVQRNGCAALRNMADSDDLTRREIGDSGSVHGVHVAMSSHPQDLDVQWLACGALQNLAIDEQNQARIGRSEGIADICRAIREHATVLRVQQQACGALHNLALNSPPNARAIAESDGINMVLMAMQQFLADAEMQWRGCRLLQNLAIDAGVRESIINAGGVILVCQALRAHPEDTMLRRYAWGSLALLASGGCAYVCEEFDAADGTTLVQQAMRDHLGDGDVQRRCCQLLQGLAAAGGSGRRRHLLALGAAHWVQAALARHPDNVEVQRKGGAALVAMKKGHRRCRLNILSALRWKS